MHVFEVPRIVMNRLSESTKSVDVRSFIKDAYPHMSIRELGDWPDQFVTVGAIGRFALRLDESDSEAVLSLYRDRTSSIINSVDDALGTLRAARHSTGIWAADKGAQFAETATFTMNHKPFSIDRLEEATEVLDMLSHMSRVTREVLNLASVETSTFFEKQVDMEFTQE